MSKARKLIPGMVTLVFLCLCLGITGFALGTVWQTVEDNSFQTGGIEIDLNGGQALLTQEEFLFEPGMTVEKPFYIQNNGTWAVYYKLYFTDISGELADVLEVTVLDQTGKVLLSGRLSTLTKEKLLAFDEVLEADQRRELIARFHFPEEEGNTYQNRNVQFALSATAVQTKNNPDKEFD